MGTEITSIWTLLRCSYSDVFDRSQFRLFSLPLRKLRAWRLLPQARTCPRSPTNRCTSQQDTWEYIKIQKSSSRNQHASTCINMHQHPPSAHPNECLQKGTHVEWPMAPSQQATLLIGRDNQTDGHRIRSRIDLTSSMVLFWDAKTWGKT